MSIGKRNKDNIEDRPGLTLVDPLAMPTSDDPLRFWTNHPTENTLVDLHPFADGETENPHPKGAGTWRGPHGGRPTLIAEIAPSLREKLQLLGASSAIEYRNVLRAWWRLFDALESATLPDGRSIARLESVTELNELHEAAAHQRGLRADHFTKFLRLVNQARRQKGLGPLVWEIPDSAEPDRTLIPEEHAREIKTAIKLDWRRVLQTWERNDRIRAEAQRRATGQSPSDLSKEDEHLLKNYLHFERIKKKTGLCLPSSEQLRDGKGETNLSYYGLVLRLMRSIEHPTVEDADIAIHLAILNSGWNPSTMLALDANHPFLVADSPKSDQFAVLTLRQAADDEGQEITIAADKPRAGGRTQFCTALKKDSTSAPMIVLAYLQRSQVLRTVLKAELAEHTVELKRLEAKGTHTVTYTRQFKRVQTLRQGVRSVWLYVDPRGQINWPDSNRWNRYVHPEGWRSNGGRPVSYLYLVLHKLNSRPGRLKIGAVTPSDFRDIYARWVYLKSGGNILAVMLALGHAQVVSTVGYLENNVFAAEHDQQIRRFMEALFGELGKGRVDLTILAHLVRNGELTREMEEKLMGYRKLMRSRIGVGCEAPRKPPIRIAPDHTPGFFCTKERCLSGCANARLLPESLDGIAMRVQELMFMSDRLPRETWLGGKFDEDLQAGEYLLQTLFAADAVYNARQKWRELIHSGKHLVPGVGFACSDDSAQVTA